MAAAVGDVLQGKYRLVRVLEANDTVTVFEALHESLAARVAVKVLHDELAKDPKLVERFVHGGKLAAQVASPHVVRVTDVERTDAGGAYLVLEAIDGTTLAQRIDEHRLKTTWFSVDEAARLGLDVLEGMTAAHEAGVVHGDLRPATVLLARGAKGRVVGKLLDLGVARIKSSAEVTRIGAARYVAPERLVDPTRVDAQGDVFACGVLLFELFSGRVPVAGADVTTVLHARKAGQIVKLQALAPALPEALVAAIERAIDPSPSERFATVRALRDAIAPHVKLPDEARLTATEFVSRPPNDLPVLGSPPAPPRPDAGVAASPAGAGKPPQTMPDDDGGIRASQTEFGKPIAPIESTQRMTPTDDLAGSPQQRASGTMLGIAGAARPGSTVTDAVAPLMAPRPPGRRKQGNSSLLLVLVGVLVIGGGVSGVWWASSSHHDVDAPPMPVATPPMTTVAAQPGPTAAPAEPPVVNPAQPLPPQPTAPPGNTAPHPSASSSAVPVLPFPPALPTAFPSALPPLKVPSAFPFPLPSATAIPKLPFPLPG